MEPTGLQHCLQIITHTGRTQDYYRLFKSPLTLARIKVMEALTDTLMQEANENIAPAPVDPDLQTRIEQMLDGSELFNLE